MIKLDEEFIDKWSNIDVDEYEYNDIIKLVKNDIKTQNKTSRSLAKVRNK